MTGKLILVVLLVTGMVRRLWGPGTSHYWSFDGLLIYTMLTSTLATHTMVEPLVEWYLLDDARGLATLDFYASALNLAFVFGVFFLSWLFSRVAGSLNREELTQLRSKLLTLVTDLGTLVDVAFASWIRCGCGVELVYFMTSIAFFYIMLSVSHWIAMIKCDSMAINLDSTSNYKVLNSLVKNWMFTLLIIDLYFTYVAVTWFWNSHDVFYLGFLLRFSGLLVDSVRTRVWYGIKLKQWQASKKPGYDAERFDQQFMNVKTVSNVIQSSPALAAFFALFSPSSLAYVAHTVLNSFSLIDGARIDSLVCDMLVLKGIKKFEITKSNSMCVICNKVMAYTGNSERFEETDAVRAQCGHMFHYGCILNQLGDSEKTNECPTCQVYFYDEKTGNSDTNIKALEAKETKKAKKAKRLAGTYTSGDDTSSGTDSVISNASFLAPGSKSGGNGCL